MSVTAGRVVSAVLPAAMDYLAYLPPRLDPAARHPALFLLHGRGHAASSWEDAFALFDRMVGSGVVPPFVAVAPDAPWSGRAGYWIDSEFDGDDRREPGAPIATALVRELVPHIEETLPVIPRREARAVCGYSMGGAGALTLALGHQEVFSAAIALSPAVYDPLPPSDSTARSRGAFGRGASLFDEERYRELGYPALLAELRQELPLHLFLGVGADEEPSGDPKARPPVEEATRLAERVSATPGISAELHIVPGGHDWTTWFRLLEFALPRIVPRLTGG